mmetsp:Transcript_54185/g.65375  ORF Transcript_54185/g.65375 Transcript_54185/m.65375 type:complete len:168 (-) Transcript_54185:85-588(-)|eukprot:CAMPEP_0172508704 /NCGR_PEP_ID=MMETSP1066-20121228/214097_1 /TAXON_ID=671091 /ORGANISM="Coscinodiscus wailesii, Strain CCMP2513" /LENGTH=167 /DNA_ID=CAMNT_0013286811 /DNA_START=133 /DNA_END=636 /DNA_ORIENTATION=-
MRPSSIEALEQELIHLKLRLAQIKSDVDIISHQNRRLKNDNDKFQIDLKLAVKHLKYASEREKNLMKLRDQKKSNCSLLKDKWNKLSSELAGSVYESDTNAKRNVEGTKSIKDMYNNFFNSLAPEVSSKSVVSKKTTQNIMVSGRLLSCNNYEMRSKDEKVCVLDML